MTARDAQAMVSALAVGDPGAFSEILNDENVSEEERQVRDSSSESHSMAELAQWPFHVL